MITTERLEEMRRSELEFIQQPALPARVRFLAEEIADALGELLERRTEVSHIPVVTQAGLWGGQ